MSSNSSKALSLSAAGRSLKTLTSSSNIISPSARKFAKVQTSCHSLWLEIPLNPMNHERFNLEIRC